MASFRPEKETCPVCGRTGDCTSFASYDRYIVDFIGGKPSEAVVTVHRVMCSSANGISGRFFTHFPPVRSLRCIISESFYSPHLNVQTTT